MKMGQEGALSRRKRNGNMFFHDGSGMSGAIQKYTAQSLSSLLFFGGTTVLSFDSSWGERSVRRPRGGRPFINLGKNVCTVVSAFVIVKNTEE